VAQLLKASVPFLTFLPYVTLSPTQLHHKDEQIARELVRVATHGVADDDANIFTDTGWFPLDATEIPSGEDLAVLQSNVGDTGALDPPSSWDEVADPTVAQLHKLKEGDPERDQVVAAFLSTFKPPNFQKKAKVVQVDRIQNLAMWQSYVVKRQTICYRETQNQSKDVDAANIEAAQRRARERFERSWLWHGTNAKVMEKIMQQGFNRSFCGKNATMYGKGVYFARDAAYSAYPIYAIPDKHKNQYVMACRVVVGEYCKGTQDALTPEIRDSKTQSLYDTTAGLLSGDTMSNPSIYVTYHDAQAYPEVGKR
jgi:poly [ADP-ribose] polymerase 10/14/15